ncbi:MAG: sigma-70 family RNA polymerase sigma factor [Solirubrobacterales bacterium]|nr:sigma-70 family RNA polymerase sigma factor [Solirubrobacterales bacterium]HMT05531.1 sigma-70 family RNA polymerase sigma factor [Solirubrobacterales bacterium]
MRAARELSDAEIAARCREGDEAAWSELVDRYSRYIYAILTQAYRLSHHEAEDVFQEVFSRAFDKLDSLRDDAAIKPWLAQMARRAAIDRHRSSGREVPAEEILEGQVDREIERLDEALSLQQAMEILPEHCHEIIDRFFARDESYRTIGGALDIPPGTIASRISRCLGKLKDHLSQAEGDADVTLGRK